MALLKFFFISVFFTIIFSILWLNLSDDLNIPNNVYDDQYWGKKILKDEEPLPQDDNSFKPFLLKYNAKTIEDLNQRLNRTRFLEPLHGTTFNYGFNGNQLKNVVDYWLNKYSWKNSLNQLNRFPQFITEIEGLKVHFTIVNPEVKAKKIIPILLVHGWPGSFYEFFKLADLLKQNEDDIAFKVIIPSIPGFGWSEHPSKPGFNVVDVARIFKKLMSRLGHEKFYYHGEDWGCAIGHSIAVMYPENVEGVHLTIAFLKGSFKSFFKMLIGSYFPNLIYNYEVEAKAFSNLTRIIKFFGEEIGYFVLQSTKPDTIGSLLVDSPAGLAAYILEKYSTGTNVENKKLNDGGLLNKFTYDELITNLMIYWISENAGYSVRFYKEFSQIAYTKNDITKLPVKIPTGFSFPEHEMTIGKSTTLADKYQNLVYVGSVKDTGHFAAFENPEALNSEIRLFVKKVLEKNTNSV